MFETIHGTVERVYFASPTFSAGVIDAGSNVKVKFSGKFHIAEGEPITIIGAWEKHPKYGYQFIASSLSYDLPDTPEGLARYLAKSSAFRGIGEVTAAKIVEYAGSAEKLESLLRGNLDELNHALRIPIGTLETLREQWIAHAAENGVRTYLSAFELSPNQIDTLLEQFGEGIVSVLKADPYMLIRHVRGYGFKRVDEIARKTGVPKDHPGRIRAGLVHTVQEEIDNGHTWIDGCELVRKANDLLLLDGLDSIDLIKAAGKALIESGDLVSERQSVSLPYIYEAEKTVADTFATARMLPAFEPITGVQIPDDLNPGQSAAFSNALRERISTISGGAGTGKAQPLDAKILTPSGWQTMSDMQVGTVVVGANGLPCKVTGVYPQGQMEVYDVIFTDGTKTQCCADHLWITRSQKDRDRNRPGSVKSLREIMKTGLSQGKKRRHWIPMVKPVEFDNRDVPLDPYALGLILGDGCLTVSSACGFSNPSGEIISMLNAALPEHMRIKQAISSHNDYRLCGTEHGHNPLLVILRDLGIQGSASANKHIPDCYKFSRSGIRLALLQGLLDTDGYASGSTLEYVTVSHQLAEDVRFLVHSLGGTCACSTKEPTYTYKGERRKGQTAYRLHLCLPGYVWPFRLPRKSAAYSPRTKYQPRRAIEAIKLVGTKECQCISVDAADCLYVTNDFIVTHNTYIVGKLAQAWSNAGKNICLCAPTGKAAKRIEEVLRIKHGIADIEARTLHRVLGYDGRTFHTERIDADVIVIDEFSMVDILLCAEFFRRVDLSRTQIVLVGDHNQLPPVGPGNILRDIMAHDLVSNTVLDTVVRNAGPIERAAQQILSGTVPSTVTNEPQWAVVDSFKEPQAIQAYLRDLVLDLIPRHLGYDPVCDVQIITPVHKGALGTQSINKMMQYLIQGEVHGRFAIGDKVIQTVNDYNLGIMNGHQGRVLDIDKEGITVSFDGEEPKIIEQDKQGNLQLAYALTAHKAQGSEFPCVVVLCHKSHFFADRNWLYTAVTRAAKHVIILGDRWGLNNAAKKNEVKTRRTLLSLWSTSNSPFGIAGAQQYA